MNKSSARAGRAEDVGHRVAVDVGQRHADPAREGRPEGGELAEEHVGGAVDLDGARPALVGADDDPRRRDRLAGEREGGVEGRQGGAADDVSTGVAKVTVNWTSSPVTAPSPPVVWLGLGWMPPRTEFRAVNAGLRRVSEKVSSPGWVLSRLVKATSEGELARVTTWGVRLVLESLGKTR